MLIQERILFSLHVVLIQEKKKRRKNHLKRAYNLRNNKEVKKKRVRGKAYCHYTKGQVVSKKEKC